MTTTLDRQELNIMTELIWDGKYKDGKKVSPVRIELPFQPVETVNETAQQRQLTLDMLFAGRPTDWRNRLIWGDKKYVLPSLRPEFAGKVSLIYIDPPFATGADFSFTAAIPETDESFNKEPNIIEQKAYRDTWGHGLDSYLQWFYETTVLLRELLTEDGSIYVHVGLQVSSFIRSILDEVFGAENLRNEIVWQRFNFHADEKRFGTVHETIWYYVKSDAAFFAKQYLPVKESLVTSHYTLSDENGRKYTLDNPTAPAHGKAGKPMRFGNRVIAPPSGAMWRWKQENIDMLWAAGKIIFNEAGMPRVKRYLDETEGTAIHSIWTDIRAINSQADERVNYPTQKPEALLERIIKASSNEGDLVLDCFCGSGATAAVAEKLGRRWIACDLGRFAIHTTRKRLLSIDNVKPFVIQNLGKYERQAWQAAEFGNESGTRVLSYINFILKLYSAQQLNGYVWLHGKKGNRLLHVGSVDSPVSPLDVGQIVAEFKRSIGTGKEAPRTNGVDVLAWDFAFELNELAKQQAAQANVDVRFLRIPREVLDKKAVEQGDVHFFELESLDVSLKTTGKRVTVAIRDFVIPPDDVPSHSKECYPLVT